MRLTVAQRSVKNRTGVVLFMATNIGRANDRGVGTLEDIGKLSHEFASVEGRCFESIKRGEIKFRPVKGVLRR